jgi:two-component system, OmpR family, copper resistance phosphate regulon response regulator CusR
MITITFHNKAKDNLKKAIEIMVTKVLVVDDDSDIANALSQALTRNNFEVTVCRTGEDGFFHAMNEHYGLVLLDVVLPGRSGLEILAALRKKNTHVPIIMLSTRNEVEDRVQALSMTADDYLGKPFALSELLQRVNSLLRRSHGDVVTELRIDDLQLNSVTRSVARGSKILDLTLREFEILLYLMRKPGAVVTRAMLAQDVWKDVKRATPLDNVIDVHISRLRRKIEMDGQKELLHTVRGVGFCISDRNVNPVNTAPVYGPAGYKIPYIGNSV